jgi:hypothetical protein
MRSMSRNLSFALALPLFCLAAYAAEDVVTAVEGTVKKVDAGAKTAVIQTEDGTEHTIHFVKRTTVHGAAETAKGTKDAFHGLDEGSHVVVHYTTKGTVETAEELDKVGKDGMKVTEGTVSHIDRGAKTVTIKTADGAEETYHMAAHATKDAGKDIAEGTEKSAKVTVYYTQEAGHKVVHFFKKTT